MNLCDLHTHSLASDGKKTPSEVVALAVQAGLSAVALCDHDTVDGLPEFLAAGREHGIKAIAGAEFSVDYEGDELHLLGLFIPEDSFLPLSAAMNEILTRKKKRNLQLIEVLQKAGYQIDLNAILAVAPGGPANRVPIAEELVRKGYAVSNKEAFQTILSEETGYYKPGKRPSLLDTLDMLTALGAVPVLAHPLLKHDAAFLRPLLAAAKQRGLVGMECCYSEYSESETQTALALAAEFGLKPSGGSDYHGETKPHIEIGAGTGNLQIPLDWALALETHAR